MKNCIYEQVLISDDGGGDVGAGDDNNDSSSKDCWYSCYVIQTTGPGYPFSACFSSIPLCHM